MLKTKTKTNGYLAILIAFGLVLANATLSYAEEGVFVGPAGTDFEDTDTLSDSLAPSADPGTSEAAGTSDDNKAEQDISEQAEFIQKLKDELNMSKADYRQVLDEISTAKYNLKKISEERMSLQEQLQNLDNSIKISKKKLIDVVKQVVGKENEIKLTMEQIDKKTVEIEYQKILIKDYVRMIYEKENTYLSVDESGEIDAFKFLLSDDSVGENLKKLKYLDLLNEAGQQMIDKLEALNHDLEQHKDELKVKRQTLKYLQNELAKEKQNLDLQKDSQLALLKMTNGQERVYEQLLEQSIDQQQMVLTDLKSLSNAIVFIERKIHEEGENFDINNYSDLLDSRTEALYKFRLNNEAFKGFNWPVMPMKGISAYFRDPSYRSTFGMQHNAIDIPVYQGTPILAAADGVVYKAKDNDYGYSYIILAHADGFMTVYGHVNKIMVEEGDTIPSNTIIGLSGGMPGTLGAGYMTTGPHLHFEVLLKGAYTDPLLYLPLSVLSRTQVESQLPERYWEMWELESIEEIPQKGAAAGVAREPALNEQAAGDTIEP